MRSLIRDFSFFGKVYSFFIATIIISLALVLFTLHPLLFPERDDFGFPPSEEWGEIEELIFQEQLEKALFLRRVMVVVCVVVSFIGSCYYGYLLRKKGEKTDV